MIRALTAAPAEVSTTNAPSDRSLHTAIWTGSEMIIWGGSNGGFFNDGARYDPAADTWCGKGGLSSCARELHLRDDRPLDAHVGVGEDDG